MERRSNFSVDYTLSFLSTGENTLYPGTELRNIFDLQIITDGCTRIRSVSDWEDVTRWQSTEGYAHFEAMVNGAILTVLHMEEGSGNILVGHSLNGPLIDIGTTITEYNTGSGGIGTYTLSSTQSGGNFSTVEFGKRPGEFFSGYYPNSASDSVIFPNTSGVLRLHEDMELMNAKMQGGTIIAQDTDCPLGWTVSTLSSPGLKCYRLFENTTDYFSASVQCRESGHGSLGARLALIDSYEELRFVQGLCRGDSNSEAYLRGCWIGLMDRLGNGKFRWEQNELRAQISTDGNRGSYSLAFYDWRRITARSNITLTGGIDIHSPQRCVHLVPWQSDPLIQEQGSMLDVDCGRHKAYVCQMYASTHKYQLTLSTSSFEGDSELQGGRTLISDSTSITSLIATRSAEIVLKSTSDPNNNYISRLQLEDSSTLRADRGFTLRGAVDYPMLEILVGSVDQTTSELGRGQPVFYLSEGQSMTIDNSINAKINARVDISGTIHVGENAYVSLMQGGDLSRAELEISSSSEVSLGAYSTRLSAYDAFDLRLAHRSAVLGEYIGPHLTEEPIVGAHGTGLPSLYGVFKLGVTVAGPVIMQSITDCIPYNASAEELAGFLNALAPISERGNVTVRRIGDAHDPFFGFGFLHRIELSAIPTEYFQHERVELFIAAYGVSAGCAETSVSLLDPRGQPSCKLSGYSSKIRAESCVIPPDISLERISALSYTDSLNSGGRLSVTAGVHRMPPITTWIVASSGGRAICSADEIFWAGIVLSNYGSLSITGEGWKSWDSSFLLYLPDNTQGREWAGLSSVNSVYMEISDLLEITGVSSFLISSPHSVVKVKGQQNYWGGGIMRGVGQMHIHYNLTLGGSFKSLQVNSLFR